MLACVMMFGTSSAYRKKRLRKYLLIVSASIFPHLILLQAALLHHLIPLFLKGNDDESHKDVHEEERKDDKVDNIKDRHLHPVAVTRTSVLLCHVYGVLQDPGGKKQKANSKKFSDWGSYSSEKFLPYKKKKSSAMQRLTYILSKTIIMLEK